MTLPGEGGKDRPFKVSIKFVSLVSWHMLHEVLTGHAVAEPLDLDKPVSTNPVHAVDVVLRHLPSMKLASRSEERRVGKECLRLCRSRWSPYH